MYSAILGIKMSSSSCKITIATATIVIIFSAIVTVGKLGGRRILFDIIGYRRDLLGT